MDELVHGPLGILWFGEPGPQGMVERHAGVQAPVALAGRLFIQGENHIRAVDAFNGTLLWQRDIPGAVRVLVKADAGNLVVTDTGLYVAALDKCYRLDPATGQTVRMYEMPACRCGPATSVGLRVGGRQRALRLDGNAHEIRIRRLLASFLANGQWRTGSRCPRGIPGRVRAAQETLPGPPETCRWPLSETATCTVA